MTHWSVVLPYFNEVDYLPRTLESLAAQTLRPTRLVLVDNASTDGSATVAREVMGRYPHIATLHLSEPRPGKIPAMATGLREVATPFVATWDADTWYPPEYLARCNQLFLSGGPACMAVLACYIHGPPDSPESIRKRHKILRKARRFPNACHAGGYAQAFRTEALRAVGGYDERIWPYVLSDHEIVHRLLKKGRTAYSFDHWCLPSTRRTDRRRVAWNRFERLIYRYSPSIAKDWFFYRFLAKRFAARGLNNTRLREQSWAGSGKGGQGVAAP
jgi:glycosyltransferase involved in cell wall biosynthesis